MFVYLFRSRSSFCVDLFVCLFCYCSLPVTALPNYVITLLYLPLVRLFVLCCFSGLLMCSFYVSAVVLLLSCYSLVRLFLCCLFNLVFLRWSRSFVRGSSLGLISWCVLGWLWRSSLVRVAYVFVAIVRVGCGKICKLFNAWRWRWFG